MNDDYKDVSGLLEEDVSKVEGGTDMKVDTDEKISVADKIDIGDKIEIIKPIVPIKPIRTPKFAAMRTMAEHSIPKPITRRDIYQYCIAGGDMTDYALPYPITLEEKYLAKICGMDIDVPEPVQKYKTIEQGREVWHTTKLPIYYQYLYALCGFEWDVPYPVIRRDMYLYKNLGYEIEVPEPITREEIYWNGGQPTPTTIEGVPPLTFTAKRTGNLEDYTIYGNSVQSGTPTPDSPIEPEFVGDLVSIELDEPLRAVGDYKDTLDLATGTLTRRIAKIELDKLSWTLAQGQNHRGFRTSYSNQLVEEAGGLSNSLSPIYETSIVSQMTDKSITFYNYLGQSIYMRYDEAEDVNELLSAIQEATLYAVLAEPIVTTLSSIPDGLTGVIEGTVTQSGTPTPDNPIEPVFNGKLLPNGKYQVYKAYKIPISSGGVTKTIYLGQTPTTRKIKKLVLTGEETIQAYSSTTRYVNNIPVSVAPVSGSKIGLCTHYFYNPAFYTTNGSFIIDLAPIYWYRKIPITDNRFTTADDFKSYLAAQYAAGTPVTVWYVLAEPETAVVNEPLCRIGDYADSITFEQAGVEIPVTAGANTLTVGTEIQPSNMMISYK